MHFKAKVPYQGGLEYILLIYFPYILGSINIVLIFQKLYLGEKL